MNHRTSHGSGGRGPTRTTHSEEDNRMDWWLREQGRFPNRDELVAIREYKEWAFEYWDYLKLTS